MNAARRRLAELLSAWAKRLNPPQATQTACADGVHEVKPFAGGYRCACGAAGGGGGQGGAAEYINGRYGA